ncbi:MAG: hypothetical protein EXX96DRAFT_578579 [Benjaminiella poitrasii]|nr:MAG: hypothetical protein EXX96DRAFT_578579 [Benjaminiella poitrasii]
MVFVYRNYRRTFLRSLDYLLKGQFSVILILQIAFLIILRTNGQLMIYFACYSLLPILVFLNSLITTKL